MKTLHILKSQPDDLTAFIVDADCRENNCRKVETYGRDVDWHQLVDWIFEADKVVCWW